MIVFCHQCWSGLVHHVIKSGREYAKTATTASDTNRDAYDPTPPEAGEADDFRCLFLTESGSGRGTSSLFPILFLEGIVKRTIFLVSNQLSLRIHYGVITLSKVDLYHLRTEIRIMFLHAFCLWQSSPVNSVQG